MPHKDPEVRKAYHKEWSKRRRRDPEHREKVLASGRQRANAYYKKHRQRTLDTIRERTAWLNAYKIDRGCSRCGFDAHVAPLQFHHRDPAAKLFTIGQRSPSRAWTKILDEVAKCDVICANCHWIEHAECLNGLPEKFSTKAAA